MSNMLREDWRAGYTETCKSGSEGSSTKPNTAMCHGRVVLTLLFVAGTVENSLGERESHRVERQQVCTDRGGLNREDNLHHIARQEFEQVLDRTIGQEWRLLRTVGLDEMTVASDLDENIAFVRHNPELEF